jgi:hypothetical protein
MNGCWAYASGETGSLCYWNFLDNKEAECISEELLCWCEQNIERSEFMSDWKEYIGEYDG